MLSQCYWYRIPLTAVFSTRQDKTVSPRTPSVTENSNLGRWPTAVSDSSDCTEFFPILGWDLLTYKVCPLGLVLPHKMIYPLSTWPYSEIVKPNLMSPCPHLFSFLSKLSYFLFLFFVRAFYLGGWSPLCSNFKIRPLNLNIILKAENSRTITFLIVELILLLIHPNRECFSFILILSLPPNCPPTHILSLFLTFVLESYFLCVLNA